MRPVNLLPSDQRPRTASDRQGGANLALGGLAAILILVIAYVFTANSVVSRKDQAARANLEAVQAEASAAPLKGFADFAELKRTREGSVRQVATARFDWERSMRELARLLPGGVWLRQLDASPPGGADSSGGASPQPDASAGTVQAGGPTLKLSGCARSQRSVAATLVRLRGLRSAADVSLVDSSKPATGAGAAGGSTPASGSASSGGGGPGDCGPNYKFDATVAFRPSPSGDQSTEAVPPSTGGGK